MSMFPNIRQEVVRVEVSDRFGVVRQRNRQALRFGEIVVSDEERLPAVKTLTKQDDLAMSDINNIMKKYRATGLLPQLVREPFYGDFTNIPDYQESLNIVIRGQEAFAKLPSDLRTRFDNDPAKFLAFASDPKNLDEMVKLGLAQVREPSDTDRIVEAVNGLRPAEPDAEAGGAGRSGRGGA